ncbi:MAG: beta-N-acetylhexosaminidase [Betaproteobacteria bacterium]|nr:beta-N-acetylhexosaminidase [Betaproteobacteria bacterium]
MNSSPSNSRSQNSAPSGPLMIDIAGPEMVPCERERLAHPLVGGLILFARNYRAPRQLEELCAEARALRARPLLIAIDHEGGRVQRCREGFTRVPPMRVIGSAWERDAAGALRMAEALGYVLAAELRACGVDFSFTPVLDLDWGRSAVIGDRAFHSNPETVVALAAALISGLKKAGMRCCGKHFPGHGWACADSHHELPVDERELAALAADLLPYRRLALDAVMPAHIVYPRIDAMPAGFSRFWIDYLRHELGFTGAIFSDDLSMQGAYAAGDILARADAAQQAGCDMLPVCNDPEAVSTLLERWQPAPDPSLPLRAARIEKLLPDTPQPKTWRDDPLYREGQVYAEILCAAG